MLLFVKDNLREARAVAQVNEKEIAEIAPPVNPAHQDNIFVRVCGAQVPAVMCTLQCSE
jgi:hypothetical protein